MRQSAGVLLVVIALGTLSACGAGRVRAGQATEIRQEEVYEPETKVDPPEGNIERLPETYPFLEVDLERKEQPYEPELHPHLSALRNCASTCGKQAREYPQPSTRS